MKFLQSDETQIELFSHSEKQHVGGEKTYNPKNIKDLLQTCRFYQSIEHNTFRPGSFCWTCPGHDLNTWVTEPFQLPPLGSGISSSLTCVLSLTQAFTSKLKTYLYRTAFQCGDTFLFHFNFYSFFLFCILCLLLFLYCILSLMCLIMSSPVSCCKGLYNKIIKVTKSDVSMIKT